MKKNCVILKWNPAISPCKMCRFPDDIVWEENVSDWSIDQIYTDRELFEKTGGK